MKIIRTLRVDEVTCERGNGPIRYTIRMSYPGWGDEVTLHIRGGALPDGVIRSMQGQAVKITATFDFGEYDADT